MYPIRPEYLEYNPMLPDAIIVDIDWTVAFKSDERWIHDYDKVSLDIPNMPLIKMLPMFKNLCPVTIFFITGRSATCRKETISWFKCNSVIYDFLFMRLKWDKRCDTVVKWEIYEANVLEKYNVLAVFEDRNRVVDERRLKYKLPVFQTWYWDF